MNRFFAKYLPGFSSPRRFLIILLLTLFFYVLFIKGLFIDHRIIVSVGYLFVLFFLIHFLYIDIKHYSFWHIAGFFALLCCVSIIVVWSPDWHIISALLGIHLGFLSLVWYLSGVAKERVWFYSFSYFTTGGYIFTVLAAIAYGLTLLGLYSKFPFTCTDLSGASQQMIDTFAHPFSVAGEKAEALKKQSASFFTITSVQEFLLGGSGNTTVNQPTDTTTKSAGLIGKLNTYKMLMVDQVIQDKNTINMGICDYLLTEINKRYDNPNFQFSLIVLIFLLLYPFIRIGFYITSFLALAIFKILYGLKVYKPYIHKQKTETII